MSNILAFTYPRLATSVIAFEEAVERVRARGGEAAVEATMSLYRTTPMSIEQAADETLRRMAAGR